MNFREAEAYLLSLGNEVETMKLGLDKIRRLLAALGDPQKNYLKVQVAGTNGKGSVCAFLRSICLEAGINAGVFTSPHLISITERVNIGGVNITEDDFALIATTVRETSDQLLASGEIDGVPTFFEQVTAIALLAFAEAKVEVAILETGLGGRLDATTAANAEIAAITRVDYDHQKYLGETLGKIAAEKAAIIRSDSEAVIVGEQDPRLEKVILDRCAEMNVVRRVTSQLKAITTSDGAVVFESWGKARLGLKGRHQIENAKVAIMTASALCEHFAISVDQILDGLEGAQHPGRLEFTDSIVLDGAHNISGAKALVEYLHEFEKRSITLIFGAMNDKDVGEMLSILLPSVERLIFTQADNSRAMSTSELLDQVPRTFDQSKVGATASVMDAMAKAREVSTANGLIVIAGSLYLVGEAKRILNN